MKRGVFEALFISALAYTVVASAAMPTRAQETVVYPVRPMEERNVDSFLDKVRRSIFTQIRAAAQEARIERTDNDGLDEHPQGTAEADGYLGEDSDALGYAGAGCSWENSGGVEEVAGADSGDQMCAGSSGELETTEGNGADSADPVLTEWQYYGNCRITHYDAGACCCGEWATGCTASGVLATTHHTVATGDDLPFGTELLINGEVYVVEDRGVDPYCVDIFVEDHLQALELGMYYTDVYMRY